MVPSDVGSIWMSPSSLSDARWRISRGARALDRTRTEVAMQVLPSRRAWARGEVRFEGGLQLVASAVAITLATSGRVAAAHSTCP